jgi:hypothetical protein
LVGNAILLLDSTMFGFMNLSVFFPSD